jgi:hypothetical protein
MKTLLLILALLAPALAFADPAHDQYLQQRQADDARIQRAIQEQYRTIENNQREFDREQREFEQQRQDNRMENDLQDIRQFQQRGY